MAFVGIHRQVIEYGDLTCQYRFQPGDGRWPPVPVTRTIKPTPINQMTIMQ